MRVWFISIFSLILLNGGDFISEFEYGQMLYKNPRGVSCASCHGALGEGSYIASIFDNNHTEIKFSGPDIRALNFDIFKKVVVKGGKIMPKYYLTRKEIEAIYKYIRVVNNYDKPQESRAKVDKSDENLTEIKVDENYTLEDNTTNSNNTILGKIFKDKEE